jgi:hypothetical protein
MYKLRLNAVLRTFSIPVLLLLCVLILGLLPACQPSPRTQTPPALTPPPVPPAPPSGTPQEQPPAPVVTPGSIIKWAPDGVISADEYQQSKTYGDFSISWSNDNQYLYTGIKAKTAGWVAVGFGVETLMKNADIIMGFVKDGNLTIADTFSTGDFGPHPPDTQLGGTDDILASAGKADNGYTTVEFKRKLDTGDKFDKPLSKGVNKIIWAYANEPVLTIKHSSRGPGEIELK